MWRLTRSRRCGLSEASGEFDFLARGQVIRIAVGSVVLVAQGPFEGKRGIVEAQLRDDRYKLAVNGFSVLAPAGALRQEKA